MVSKSTRPNEIAEEEKKTHTRDTIKTLYHFVFI